MKRNETDKYVSGYEPPGLFHSMERCTISYFGGNSSATLFDTEPIVESTTQFFLGINAS
jgi:hypothetical protein